MRGALMQAVYELERHPPGGKDKKYSSWKIIGTKIIHGMIRPGAMPPNLRLKARKGLRRRWRDCAAEVGAEMSAAGTKAEGVEPWGSSWRSDRQHG